MWGSWAPSDTLLTVSWLFELVCFFQTNCFYQTKITLYEFLFVQDVPLILQFWHIGKLQNVQLMEGFSWKQFTLSDCKQTTGPHTTLEVKDAPPCLFRTDGDWVLVMGFHFFERWVWVMWFALTQFRVNFMVPCSFHLATKSLNNMSQKNGQCTIKSNSFFGDVQAVWWSPVN